MKLHQLKNGFTRQSRKRVGRGDGSQGRTCGRGEKGAGARSGNTYRPYFEGGQMPLFRRLPKRGFNNPNHTIYSVVNVSYLENNFVSGDKVDKESLKQRGLISNTALALKILGDGELTKSLKITADKFSTSAKKKIEAAGGACLMV